MRSTLLFLSAMLITACASTPPTKTASPRKPASVGDLMDPTDPRLIDTSADPMTVWKAIQMTQSTDGRAQLDQMFDQAAVSLTKLPQGYAAGAGLPEPNVQAELNKVLSMITGNNWRGKIFCAGTPYETHGLNRIRGVPLITTAKLPVVPMAGFKAALITPDDPRNFATTAKSNVVILNYADPVTDDQHSGPPYWVEYALKVPHVGAVYDVMVAVPGKYGPVYLGKTWVGTYDANGDFHPDHPDQLIARYFLDFNAGALKDQKDPKSSHWPRGQTEMPTSDGNNCQGVTLP